MASRREFGKRAVRAGVRKFYDSVGISLPFGEFRVDVGVEQYHHQRWSTDVEQRMARCWNVGEWQVSGGVFE